MHFNKQLKIFKRALARGSLFFFAWLFERLPYPIVYFLGKIFMAVGYCFIIKQKRIARESLQIALGREKTLPEIKEIERSCFLNIGEGMLEMLYYMAHPKKIKEKIILEGEEHLHKALKEGSGVIAITAHFGNFPLMMLYFATGGYPTNTIMRPARDQGLEEYLLRRRTEVGLKTVYTIPRRECVQNSLKVLRNNEILFIPLDQNFGGEGGVFVDFFGQKAATATGPVVFSLRTKAPILLMFIVRQKDNRHKIIIEPPVLLEDKGDEQETILINTARITQMIERYIRQYPDHWGWMHRRWKSRPQGETPELISPEE